MELIEERRQCRGAGTDVVALGLVIAEGHIVEAVPHIGGHVLVREGDGVEFGGAVAATRVVPEGELGSLAGGVHLLPRVVDLSADVQVCARPVAVYFVADFPDVHLITERR